MARAVEATAGEGGGVIEGSCTKIVAEDYDENRIRIRPDHDFVEVSKRHLIKDGWALYCRRCGELVSEPPLEPSGDLVHE